MQASHCPYSKYPVGAAVIDSQGSIFSGCNVENSAFGSTICAEAAAIAQAVVQCAPALTAIAVVTNTHGTPCGNCRQILAEQAPDCVVLLATPSTLDTPLIKSVAQLLPEAFDGLG